MVQRIFLLVPISSVNYMLALLPIIIPRQVLWQRWSRAAASILPGVHASFCLNLSCVLLLFFQVVLSFYSLVYFRLTTEFIRGLTKVWFLLTTTCCPHLCQLSYKSLSMCYAMVKEPTNVGTVADPDIFQTTIGLLCARAFSLLSHLIVSLSHYHLKTDNKAGTYNQGIPSELLLWRHQKNLHRSHCTCKTSKHSVLLKKLRWYSKPHRCPTRHRVSDHHRYLSQKRYSERIGVVSFQSTDGSPTKIEEGSISAADSIISLTTPTSLLD